MGKKILIFCFAIGFLFTLGWGGRDEAFGAAKRYKMVFIVKSMDNPFWNMMLEGAQMAAKDLGLEIKGLAPIKPNNVEEQIRQMEDAITAKMDAIIVVPSDSKGIVPGIEKANRAGIPVFTSNTRAFGGKFIGFAGAPNEEAAYLVAKAFLEVLGGKGNVIILEGVPGAQTAIDRKSGCRSGRQGVSQRQGSGLPDRQILPGGGDEGDGEPSPAVSQDRCRHRHQ